MSKTKYIPDNCNVPLSGKGARRCKYAAIVETRDGRMVCGHHAKMIADDLDRHDPPPP